MHRPALSIRLRNNLESSGSLAGSTLIGNTRRNIEHPPSCRKLASRSRTLFRDRFSLDRARTTASTRSRNNSVTTRSLAIRFRARNRAQTIGQRLRGTRNTLCEDSGGGGIPSPGELGQRRARHKNTRHNVIARVRIAERKPRGKFPTRVVDEQQRHFSSSKRSPPLRFPSTPSDHQPTATAHHRGVPRDRGQSYRLRYR